MNILIISAPHPYKVAGTVALNLYTGLKNKGHRVTMLVKAFDEYKEPDIHYLQTKSAEFIHKATGKILRTLNRFIPVIKPKDPNYCIQDADETHEYYTTKKILSKIDFKPDVILYIFPGNLLNAKNLFELNKQTGAPVFWYLMDSAALTGGCHYSWDCMRYTTGCGKCPALYSNDAMDQSAINFQFKKLYHEKTAISLIAATEWQYQMALKSLLFKGKEMYKILLPVDPVMFNYALPDAARKKLGIAKDRKVIFFGSAFLGEKRKGMKYLSDALQFIKNQNQSNNEKILLLVAGNRFDLIQPDLPFEYKHLGLLANNEDLAEAFHASDFFVCPSIEDSGPMMINQSLMCGKPVVAFEMGVAMDLVINDQTGYRAKLMDSSDLANGISKMLTLDETTAKQYAQNCRMRASETCSPEVQIEKFEKLFAQ